MPVCCRYGAARAGRWLESSPAAGGDRQTDRGAAVAVGLAIPGDRAQFSSTKFYAE
jgi:hypothetical protein